MYMSFGFDITDHYMLTCLGLGQGLNTFACPSHVERVLSLTTGKANGRRGWYLDAVMVEAWRAHVNCDTACGCTELT